MLCDDYLDNTKTVILALLTKKLIEKLVSFFMNFVKHIEPIGQKTTMFATYNKRRLETAKRAKKGYFNHGGYMEGI